MEVNENTKVRMFVDIGIANAQQEDVLTLGELGWSGEQGEELTKFLEQCANDFKNEHLDFGADIIKD